MKIKYLLTTIIAITAFVACSNDDNDVAAKPEIHSVSVTLSENKVATGRALNPGEIVNPQTMNVNSVLINLTDASGTVITSKLVNKDSNLNSDWDKLTDSNKGLKFVNIPQSVSKVYVYGNPGSAVVNNTIVTNLANQQGSAVLYSGVDEDLTPIVTEPVNPDPTSGETYTANVTIVPIVSRFQITKISFKNSGSFEFSRMINGQNKSATVTWDGFTASLKGIYLNAFYNKYNVPGNLTDLLRNSTFENHIKEGMWLFDNPATDASEYASYTKYANNVYSDLPLETAGKCYAFNFFPGTEIPTLHLDLANLAITNMQSTDTQVFNPALAQSERFANIVKYYKNNTNILMTATDFKPGTLYNMEIEVIPMLDNDLGNVQYNVLVHVTIAPWVEQTLTPGFDLEQ